MAALVLASLAVGKVLRAIPGLSSASPDVRFAVFTALIVPTVVGVYVTLVRGLERRSVTELEGPRAARELAIGLALGTGLFTATIGGIALFGGYRVEGTEPASVLIAPVAMAVESGVVEEIITRGVIFRILEEWLGTWAALVISSALFGLAHIGNPHATLWSAVSIAVEAGTLLAAAYILTRRLWLAIGIHASWNYAQGAIFGVAVSGHEAKGLLHGTMLGPTWLSGGEFGAEASAVAVVVCTGAAAALLVRGLRVQGAVPPSWVRRRRAAAALPPLTPQP
jgi:membrane protease YdiL (CAAX protease family)